MMELKALFRKGTVLVAVYAAALRGFLGILGFGFILDMKSIDGIALQQKTL